jgi:hypothetical protein
MAKAKQTLSTARLDPLARQILGDLLTDFLSRKLDSKALQDGYVGMSLPALVEHYCDSGHELRVDFDLAVKQLEGGGLVKTGPMEPYKNSPNSSVFVFTLFSKREYMYITESGYRSAKQLQSGLERF